MNTNDINQPAQQPVLTLSETLEANSLRLNQALAFATGTFNNMNRVIVMQDKELEVFRSMEGHIHGGTLTQELLAEHINKLAEVRESLKKE